ncbi:uncharacterized protein V1510DRAFT_415977 [Dipodascopsis tothii]|uniref:uncharacterized protein n=1 Tax=Dipodascopsis tothii TaxID=44089 RepID=UPI0034CDCA09
MKLQLSGAVAAACWAVSASALSLPGWAAKTYAQDERIPLLVNKVSSDTTPLPYAYSSLGFVCPASAEVKRVGLNLGEILGGDRITGSDYQVVMGLDVECAQLCEIEIDKANIERASYLIRNGYMAEWFLDGLPGATPMAFVDGQFRYYKAGFPLGTFSDDVAYLNNHFALTVRTRTDPKDPERSQVVAFEVAPMSVVSAPGKCPKKAGGKPLVLDAAQDTLTVAYSYSVQFVAQTDDEARTYGDRWSHYYAFKATSSRIHWLAIVNSLLILSFLTTVVGIIMMRTLSRDIQSYNQEDQGENDKDLPEEISGWKLVHGDVFRPPDHKGVLASVIGAGVQLCVMAVSVLAFAVTGFLGPGYRGGVVSFALFLFAFAGLFSGYASSRLYKSFKGEKWLKNAMRTGLLVPGVSFGFVLVINLFFWAQSSSIAIPFGTIVALLAMWIFILLPLVVVGAWYGFKQPVADPPTRVKQIPRQIPLQHWYTRPAYAVALGGLVPFAVILVELLFIFRSVWHDLAGYYYLYGFLGATFLNLVAVVVEISVVTTYIQLCAEDYHWWWKSFFVGAGSAVWIFAYSIVYCISQMRIAGFVAGLLFVSYSLLACTVYGLCTGTVSFLAAHFFVNRIYRAVKTD